MRLIRQFALLPLTFVVLAVLAMRPLAEPGQCRVVGAPARLADLPEASGMALGSQGRTLWSHNDSSSPAVFALSLDGVVRRRVVVSGAAVHDWEAIGVGGCPQGSCLYIGDIGDNNARRRTIEIYRTREPADDAAQTDPVEVMHAVYAERPEDAEALIVRPGGELLIVTKGDTGPVAVYRVPPFHNGATVTLQRVATIDGERARKTGAAPSDRITDGSASPDGRWIALRTHEAVMFYRARDFAAGRVEELFRYQLPAPHEPQGEGLAISDRGDVWLAGEGGGKGAPGTFLRLACQLPS